MMDYSEVEFKYKADGISLSRFTEYVASRPDSKFKLASGYDHFYSSPADPDSFCRHRVGAEFNQLTFKRKTTGKNNFIRTEHNLGLDKSVSEDQVWKLCEEFGYAQDATIYKNCFIYSFPDHTMVYYVIYTEDMYEIGRFIEIEVSEDIDWGSEEAAWDRLVELEAGCKGLDLTPQKRLKKSLYEMVKHD